MGDTIKMPGGGGYDIKVVRKKDIIDCIDANIIDKDIMLAFIERLEVDITNFLAQGRWTSLPYIGTLQLNAFKERIRRTENKELLQEGKDTLDKDQYVLFRKGLKQDIAKQVRQERIYRYITSQFVTKNRALYEGYVKSKGEAYARLACYTLSKMNVVV